MKVQLVSRATWVAACSHHLQRQWRSVDPDLLEDVAAELWADAELKALEPADAAAKWLRLGMPETGR